MSVLLVCVMALLLVLLVDPLRLPRQPQHGRELLLTASRSVWKLATSTRFRQNAFCDIEPRLCCEISKLVMLPVSLGIGGDKS